MSVVSGQTGASVRVDAVHAGGTVHASVSQMTFVDVDLAVVAGEPGAAGARVRAHQIVTGAAVQTRSVDAFVNVDFASFAFES